MEILKTFISNLTLMDFVIANIIALICTMHMNRPVKTAKFTRRDRGQRYEYKIYVLIGTETKSSGDEVVLIKNVSLNRVYSDKFVNERHLESALNKLTIERIDIIDRSASQITGAR